MRGDHKRTIGAVKKKGQPPAPPMHTAFSHTMTGRQLPLMGGHSGTLTIERDVVVLAARGHGMRPALVNDLGSTQAATAAVVVHKRLLQLAKVLKQFLHSQQGKRGP